MLTIGSPLETLLTVLLHSFFAIFFMQVAAAISNKEEWIYLIRLCEDGRRYSDMCRYFVQYLDLGLEISSLERHLFSLAFHGRVTQLRNAWRIASKSMSHSTDDSQLASICHSLRQDIEALCNEAIEYVSLKIMPTCVSPDQRVYFLKFRGDFERYKAEVADCKTRSSAATAAHEWYMQAADAALCHLSPMDSIRLSLMLNFSIFYYDIYNDAERACVVAKSACDDAIDAGIRSKKHADDNDADERMNVFNTIRSNLIKWSSQLTHT